MYISETKAVSCAAGPCLNTVGCRKAMFFYKLKVVFFATYSNFLLNFVSQVS